MKCHDILNRYYFNNNAVFQSSLKTTLFKYRRICSETGGKIALRRTNGEAETKYYRFPGSCKSAGL